ncbi:LIM-domain binding protein-domain-containing protein [Trametes polyzona]|nr:LIM-domain binding protein-domain-containing protein [Trametes polyzona]
MNVQHPDMLRQGVPNMHQNLINQPFFSQGQQGQQSSAHNMGPFQNNQGSNPGLGLMGGQPGAPNPGYPLNMQQTQAGRRPAGMFMGPHPGSAPSGLNAPGGGGPSHIGIGPGPLQNMSAFPGGGMIGQPSLRRVQSQPMNPNAGHMPGMQSGMMGGGMGGGMGLNGPQNMGVSRASMTTAQQQQHMLQMRQQAQMQAQGGAMSPDMGVPINRPAHMSGPMPPHTRTPSGQALMPTSMPQHGMQQQMAHNAYQNPMSLQHQHQHQHQQSQLGTSPHVGGQQQHAMSGAMGGNPLPPQGVPNRAQMTPDNSMFIGFQNQPIQPPIVHGVPALPMGNTRFNVNFNASPTPPNPNGDITQRGNGPMNPGGPATQGLITPAQALDKLNAGSENFPGGSYGMGQPQMNGPPRPSSQHGPHNAFPVPQPQPPHPPQQSPRQADRLAGQMQPPPGPRPQSQPQSIHRQSPIPPAPNRTPRVSHTPLPMNAGGVQPGRMPPGPGQSPQGPAHQQVQPPASAPPSSHPAQIAPRPPSANAPARVAPPPSAPPAPAPQQGSGSESNATPQAAPSAPAPGPASAPASAPAPAPAPVVAPAAPPRPAPSMYPVGFGQAQNRILQLSGSLGVEHKDRLKQSYWDGIVGNFFTEKATMKLTLWKDNQQVEAKPFEIGYPILPRFFLVTSQSGVKSMTICIDGARERCMSTSHALVECANAAWTFRYQNGYSITLRGPLSADVIVQPNAIPIPSPSGNSFAQYTLKLQRIQFDAFFHDKYVALDSIQGERIPESPRALPPSPGGPPTDDPNRFDEARYHIEHAIMPAEPINAFGIPQATMRCLELAESVAQMSELIQFSKDTHLGPMDALARFADKLRATRAANRGMPMSGLDGAGPSHHAEVSSSSFDGHGMNGTPMMYVHNASNAAAGPSSQGGATGSPSQNGPRADGPDNKTSKGTPQASQPSGSTPAASASTPASAPTPGGPTTPSIPNASLKRKAPPGGRAGDDSPTTANAEQPAAKRTARKRGRTQGS